LRYHVVEQLGPSRAETKEGFLIIQGVPLGRTGRQLYHEREVPIRGDARGHVIVDREPEEVFRDETIASLNGKPLTMDHPDDDVMPSNWKEYTVGHVMYPHRGDGVKEHLLLGDLFVMDPEAIEAIKQNRIRELSIGYDAKYTEDAPGYGKQHSIICNHVALVDSGRCGPACRIGDRAPVLVSTRDRSPRIATRRPVVRHHRIYLHY
jgi:uncharacterized protein